MGNNSKKTKSQTPVYDGLSDEDKRGVDALLEQAKEMATRDQMLESLKESRIVDVSLNTDGSLKKLTIVKVCIAADLTFSPGTDLYLDGQMITDISNRRSKC